jgi:hypothetical protein
LADGGSHDHDALSSHPIMNPQVLHHLAHGDLVATPDVERLTGTRAVFADGSEVEVDEVILATGYGCRMPFLDEGLLEWRNGHPQLYLNVVSRGLDSLHVLGSVEFTGAAYQRFDEMAQLIMIDVSARETGIRKADLTYLKRTDRPDLRGGVACVDGARHTDHVERSPLHELPGPVPRPLRLAGHRRPLPRRAPPPRHAADGRAPDPMPRPFRATRDLQHRHRDPPNDLETPHRKAGETCRAAAPRRPSQDHRTVRPSSPIRVHGSRIGPTA